MDGEQFVQDCCRLSVAVGASPFGRLIAQFVTAAREPALERRHGTTTGSVASAGKQAWTRQQDAAEEGVNPTQAPVLDAKPAPASGTGACQFDDLRGVTCAATAKRFFEGSTDGPFVTAQDLNTPSSSRRRS